MLLNLLLNNNVRSIDKWLAGLPQGQLGHGYVHHHLPSSDVVPCMVCRVIRLAQNATRESKGHGLCIQPG